MIIKGWGLSAGEKVYKNQFIMQYIGEIYCINSDIGRKRLKEYSVNCSFLEFTLLNI